MDKFFRMMSENPNSLTLHVCCLWQTYHNVCSTELTALVIQGI